MRILYVLPPSKTSNEVDTYRNIPGVEVLTLDSIRFERGADLGFPSLALPWLGSPERWTGSVSWYRLLDQVRTDGVDVVISAELYSVSSVQAGRLARRLGLPHVIGVWEILDRSPLNRLPPWSAWKRWNARTVDAVVAMSDHAGIHATHMGVPPERVHVVHPGVDTTVFHPAPQLADAPHVAFVGELRPDKGILDVIAACDRIAPDVGSAFRLSIMGRGPLADEVSALAATRPWMDVLGFVPRSDIPDILRSSRLLLSAPWERPLWAEQFGFNLVEAMACGLPVVTTACGAIPEIVPSHNPICAEHDIAAMADGVLRAIGADGREWGRRNRQVVEEQFDVGRQGRLLGTVLESVLASVPAPTS